MTQHPEITNPESELPAQPDGAAPAFVDNSTQPPSPKSFPETAADFGQASFHAAARAYELTKLRTSEAVDRVKAIADDSEKRLTEQQTGGVKKTEVYFDVAKILASWFAIETACFARDSAKVFYEKAAELKDPHKREVEKQKLVKEWHEAVDTVSGFMKHVAAEWQRLGQTPLPN